MYLTILDSIDSQNINKLKINKISPRRHHPIPLDQVHNWFRRGLTIIWTRSHFTPWTWSTTCAFQGVLGHTPWTWSNPYFVTWSKNALDLVHGLVMAIPFLCPTTFNPWNW